MGKKTRIRPVLQNTPLNQYISSLTNWQRTQIARHFGKNIRRARRADIERVLVEAVAFGVVKTKRKRRQRYNETDAQWLRRSNQRIARVRESERVSSQARLDFGSVYGARLGLNRDQLAYAIVSGALYAE